jgi:hypothetical protein
MSRKLRFDLNVDPNALLAANPQEFYSKAYVSQDIVDNFRTVAGVKSETKLANVLFTNLTKDSSCSFSAGSQPLDAVDIDVCPLSALAEICRFDLEASFLSAQMAQGSNGNWTVQSFMDYYWGEMASQINAEISTIMWQGDTTLPASPATFLEYCDGFERRLTLDSSVIDITAAGSVTAGNVIAEMNKVFIATPAAIKFKTSDLRFYVSPDIAAAYLLAAASGNTQTFVTTPLPLTFLGIKLVVCEGMSNKKMVLTLKDNLIYAFDGVDDSKALKAVNLEDTVAEPLLRTRVNYKVGFHIVNPAEIVFYA